MLKAIITTISIAVLFLCACGLLYDLKQARQRARQKRRERAARKRYLKRFLKNQRECDAMFKEHEADKREAERRRKKWDKQNFTCHNPNLEVFLNGVGL